MVTMTTLKDNDGLLLMKRLAKHGLIMRTISALLILEQERSKQITRGKLNTTPSKAIMVCLDRMIGLEDVLLQEQ